MSHDSYEIYKHHPDEIRRDLKGKKLWLKYQNEEIASF